MRACCTCDAPKAVVPTCRSPVPWGWWWSGGSWVARRQTGWATVWQAGLSWLRVVCCARCMIPGGVHVVLVLYHSGVCCQEQAQVPDTQCAGNADCVVYSQLCSEMLVFESPTQLLQLCLLL
jgi:hypothetical protein